MQVHVHNHASGQIEEVDLEATVLVREILAITDGDSGDVLILEERDEVIDLELSLEDAGIEHGHHVHRKPPEVVILVNSREKRVPRGRITYERVVELAFGEVPTGDGITVTVVYRRGPSGHPQGSLVAGGSVEVVKGMCFDVDRTDRS